MREILFRGKCNETCKYNGQWIEGFYGEDDGKPIIVRSTGPGFGYFCEPDSIGQYTGLTDKFQSTPYACRVTAKIAKFKHINLSSIIQ